MESTEDQERHLSPRDEWVMSQGCEGKHRTSTSEGHLPEKIEASLKMSERREVTGS